VDLPIGARALVRAPATSANLGPGFDVAGLALDLVDEVAVEVTADAVEVEVIGEGAGAVPLDERHLVIATLLRTLADLGVTAPGLRLRATNRIPHGRGLGSSAAAISCGVLLARHLAGADTTAESALPLAAELEGHPDNVAACLMGGFTLAWSDTGASEAISLPVHEQIRALALIPAVEVSTEVARALLPASVPFETASANSARAALLPVAMTVRPGLLFAATADRLHQDARTDAYPDSMALVRRLRADGHAAFISGAGPTVLVLGTDAGGLEAIAATAPEGVAATMLNPTRGAVVEAA
jgi:homoserine kinase